MPSISRIRFTNVVYDGGRKRYIDTTFRFDGFNGILLLENGAGKTVFVQTLIQAVLPHKTVAQRKIQETLQLSNTAAHIAVEWILEDNPRRYALTLVSLFLNSKDILASQEFAYEYSPSDRGSIEHLPLVQRENGQQRPATKEEVAAFCRSLAASNMNAHFFSENDSLQSYGRYIEEHFRIIPAEWHKIAAINESEGGVEAFFENCRTNDTLVGRLLIPTVEEGIADENGTGKEQGNGFAELFEKQRDHFRQQRILQKRITEMQGVVERMADYTEVQHEKYRIESELQTANGKLKTLYQRVQQISTQRQERHSALQAQAEKLQQEQARLTQSIEACDVRASQHAADAQQQLYQQAEMAHQEAKQHLQQNDQRLQSLHLAHLRQEKFQALQAEKQAQEQLQALMQDADAQSLQTQLETNSAHLHYYFQQQEQACTAQQKKVQARQTDLQQAQRDTVQKLQALHQEEKTLDHRAGQCEAIIRQAIGQMEKIEQTIFDDSLNQDASTQRSLWEHQLQQIRAQLADDEKNLAFYTEQKHNLQADLPAHRQQLEQLQQDLQALATQISAIDSTAKELLQELQQQPECANMAGSTQELYQRASFLTNQLGDSLVRETSKQKKLSFICRQAHRFVDLYAEADAFTADPLLPDLLQDWQKDFSVLQSGADAYRAACRSGQDGAELLQRYPFWAAAVITTEDSTAELLRRLQAQAARLTTPVFILTSGELRTLLNGGELPAQPAAVLPAYWQHMEEDAFRSWLEEQRTEAGQRDTELQQQEALCAAIQQLRARLTRFYAKQPFSEYQELQNSQQEAQRKAEVLQKNLRDSEQTIEQCQKHIESCQQDRYAQQKQKDQIEHKLRELVTYEELQAQHRRALQQQNELRHKLRATQEKEEAVQHQQEQLATQLQELAQELGAIAANQTKIHEDIYYAEVQNAAPQNDTRAYAILADERRQLKSRLEGIQQNRGRLEEKLQQAQREQKRLIRIGRQLLADAAENNLVLDETLTYPIDGELLEQRLRQTRPQLLAEARDKQQQSEACRAKYDKAAGRAESTRDHYFQHYEELPELIGDPATQKADFQKQRMAVTQALSACVTEARTNDAQLTRLETMQHELDKHNVTLQFTVDRIPAAILPEAWQSDDSQVFVQAYPALLRDSHAIFARYEKQRETTEQAQKRFIAYCEQHIREERRRRHIVDGIRSKNSYEEYEAWHDVILKTIQQSITLAENERKEHFTHIEHMIEHMALYLQEIGHGLKEIAAKTRIRTNGQAKDIYTIHFAEKKDSEMRTAIRNYLSSLTERLDAASFLDEDGREDSRKIQDELQKKLSTQQLLHAVLGAHAIKVKCRKATSAATFSERPYDWEESNKWSGGEVWCKNMALFLGCLNYLSEKRVRIPHTKYNNRVVVADNPFGKASSDHVLDPVFFIAEQLGFQVIALTAHEDGNFVRKYFPVVYSCRFAELSGGRGKVLEPEMQLKTAFFEEHHPEALDRLETYTEIGLFDML